MANAVHEIVQTVRHCEQKKEEPSAPLFTWMLQPSILPHAIHEVIALAVHLALDEPVHVGLEAREALVEVAREAQVVDDRLVEALARDQQRNARRIRRQQDRGGAAFQLLDRDALDVAARHLGKGVRRLHRRDHVRQVHLGRQARHVVLLVEGVDLRAQVAQAAVLVARVGGGELRHHLPHLLVAVVVVLELLECRNESIPAALGDPDREHDEERIQAALLDDDAVLGQVLGDDRGRDAGLAELAVQGQAGPVSPSWQSLYKITNSHTVSCLQYFQLAI
jgi:hypothetical protein